jgi:hypothetical protein
MISVLRSRASRNGLLKTFCFRDRLDDRLDPDLLELLFLEAFDARDREF